VGSRLYPPQVFYPFNEKTVILRLLKNAPAFAEASAGRQMQVESSKSRLEGFPKSFVGNGFKPFPTAYAATSLPRA